MQHAEAAHEQCLDQYVQARDQLTHEVSQGRHVCDAVTSYDQTRLSLERARARHLQRQAKHVQALFI